MIDRDLDLDDDSYEDDGYDLDATGVGDLLANLDVEHPVDKFYESMEETVDDAIAQIDEDEAAENIMISLDRNVDFENYSPPYNDDEDVYSDGEQDEEEPVMAPQEATFDKGYN